MKSYQTEKGYFGLKSSKSHSQRNTLTLWPGCWGRDSAPGGADWMDAHVLRVHCLLNWMTVKKGAVERQRRNMGQQSSEKTQSQGRQKERELKKLRTARGPAVVS